MDGFGKCPMNPLKLMFACRLCGIPKAVSSRGLWGSFGKIAEHVTNYLALDDRAADLVAAGPA